MKNRQVIRTSRALAAKLAELALRIRKSVRAALSAASQEGAIKKLFNACFGTLLPDADEDSLADMFAQTIVYGLFSARCSRPFRALTAENLKDMIPKTSLFLRELLFFMGGRKSDFDELGIHDVVEMLRDADMDAVLRDFGDKNPSEDPVIHFYEDFLSHYDAQQKIRRGVFYTPRPVVSFLVRSVQELLKKDFGLAHGLADISTWGEMADSDNNLKIPEGISADTPFVQILDPATGTGTFLVEVIDLIHKTMRKKWEGEGRNSAEIIRLWNEYVPKHLLPRVHGFELMMAPCAIAHMKISRKLAETGYLSDSREVIRIYPANSLASAKENLPEYQKCFSSVLAQETKAANHAKKNLPVTVIIGNPPYSGISVNNDEWIRRLVADYKYINGEYFKERKHWLNDDYVKFVRLGQHFLDKAGKGILAYVNNHSFAEHPTFRGMRWNLLRSFHAIYILDLHGNSRKKEVCPDGAADKNVFDIQTGVSANFFIKKDKKGEYAKVRRFDLWGSRESKYQTLSDSDLKSLAFNEVSCQKPFYFFQSKNFDRNPEYEKGFRIDHLFPSHVTGIVTMGDRFIVDENRERLKERLRFFKENNVDESWLNKKFALGKNYARWILKNKSSITIDEAKLAQLAYRPFDTRWTYFDNKFIWRWRADTMRHFLKGENAGLVFRRQSPEGKDIYIFVSNTITADGYIRSDNKGGESAAPLYLYPETDEVQSADTGQKRIPNLNREIAAQIAKGIDLTFTPEKENSKGTFAPIDILDYVYAVLHSPAYRQKYKEFLKIDFPRVPYPKNAEIFRHLVHFGTELRQIHLLEHPKTAEFVTAFPQNGSNAVEKIRWDSGKVWINKKQRFENVAQPAWEFCIGGYRPAQKWLKDRKGRILTSQDIEHCHKIIAALKETHRIMGEIDRTIEKYGETKIRTD